MWSKFGVALAVTILLTAAPIATGAAAAADAGHSRHHADRSGKPAYRPGVVAGEPGFVSNGAFDWRRRRYGEVPWYAYGYSPDCMAWTPHAYHYACDTNSRY